MPEAATDATTAGIRERGRADRYHEQLCRVAYLVGFYGARAGHTRNPDLTELVRQLDEITRDGQR
ncbi:hypothetical protein [Actinophytocola sp.]|uniref:hypothetical protein n=1 Tax=Actinophytocola sp. TaxID=1872138 RepID=UPI002D809A81|nr:hypothetical protein [Actinophytocola sp.]HET9137924.1 hypothetical protein [Actinophytocola sp.]